MNLNNLVKRSRLVFAHLAILIILFIYVQTPKVYSTEPPAQEKALMFLNDVVGLDIEKYNLTLRSHVEYREDMGLYEERLYYILESEMNTLTVSIKFRNNSLSYYSMSVIKGSPIYVQKSVNVINETKRILERYQICFEASYLRAMREMLNQVTEIKAMTLLSNNLKLNLTLRGNWIEFRWFYTSNGLDFVNKGVYIRFEKGNLDIFADGWRFYKIGSDRLNISRNDAVQIARSFAESLPWKLYKDEKQFMENTSWVSVRDALVESPLQVELLIWTREPLTLYPIWRITLYFNWLYYGNLCGVTVAIWADNGEISYYEPVSFLGGFPEESSPQSQPQEPTTPTPSEDSAAPPNEPIIPEEPRPELPPTENSNTQVGTNLIPIIIAIPTILTIILGATLYKKKKKITPV